MAKNGSRLRGYAAPDSPMALRTVYPFAAADHLIASQGYQRHSKSVLNIEEKGYLEKRDCLGPKQRGNSPTKLLHMRKVLQVAAWQSSYYPMLLRLGFNA